MCGRKRWEEGKAAQEAHADVRFERAARPSENFYNLLSFKDIFKPYTRICRRIILGVNMQYFQYHKVISTFIISKMDQDISRNKEGIWI